MHTPRQTVQVHVQIAWNGKGAAMTNGASAIDRFAGGARIEHSTIAVAGVPLHFVQAGPADGPLLFLLHGFPEFWFAWREHIGPLAQAGFRVVAPDQRGYNFSGKPRGVDAYRLDRLAEDIFDLADALGGEALQVVGHDWGASVAWWMATRRPARVRRMVALSAPHPAVWRRAMAEDREQRQKSRYVQMLRLPWLPEALIKAGGYSGLAKGFATAARPQAFGPEILAGISIGMETARRVDRHAELLPRAVQAGFADAGGGKPDVADARSLGR